MQISLLAPSKEICIIKTLRKGLTLQKSLDIRFTDFTQNNGKRVNLFHGLSAWEAILGRFS